MSSLAVDDERLWGEIMTLAQIGGLPAGGCDRLALTEADGVARSLLRYWFEQAGLSVSVDPIGNVFGRREGTQAGLPPVFVGSHLDTQSPGGKFDGVLGVVAGLECIRTLDEAGVRTRRPIEIVNWTNEEGARFAPGLMGSAVFTGQLPLATAQASKDPSGTSVAEALARIRQLGDAPMQRPVDSYFELHIEQGDRLQEAGHIIGVVEGSEFNCFADVTCLGDNAHAQATPMGQRRNPLAAAAELITAIEAIGHRNAPVGSMGVASMRLWPNNRINIPHRVVFTYSGTHPDRAGMAAMRREIGAAAVAIAQRTGIAIELEPTPDREAVDFDPGLAVLIEEIVARQGLTTMRLRSRAGHDAIRMAPYCPTQMIFVPCKDGISHSEFEDCRHEDAAAGANVLLHALVARADRAD